MLTLLEQFPPLLMGVALLLGLLVGSFLNVVIYRLPVMLQRDWRRDCHEFLQLPYSESAEVFNLMWPASHCPACNAPIKAYQNIPVLSYLLLAGRCAHCGTAIAWRYPLVEALTGLCSALVTWKLGFGLGLAFGLLLTWSLIALSFIDFDHQLLPDSITLPMLWLGLLLSLFGVYAEPRDAIIGAAAGYLALWSVYQGFKLLTGKEGMGFGDFKLLALLGAWFGWQYLPQIVLLSSLLGALVGVTMIATGRREASKPIPFGPYLAAAGWIAMLWGDDINRWYLHFAGLN
ncbi:prepilin peptidase [Methylomonas sp. MED-D]|uniref:prepilin peptidase n=1 Tax=Methylomonas sp. MED-D TaxID=3418768 RepID=UPI003D02BB3E